MAKLPGYDAKQGITTEVPTVKRDMAQEGMRGDNIATLGKAASDISAVWQKAEDFSQTLAQKNYMDQSVTDVLQRFEADPNGRKLEVKEKYQKELQGIKNKSLEGFTNNQAQMEFSADVNAQINSAGIKIESFARAKMIDYTQAELITSHELNKKAFLATGDPAFMAIQKKATALAKEKGFVNNVFVAEEAVKVEEWEKYRYIQMAEEGNPQGAIDMIYASDMSPTDKASAVASVKTITANATAEIDLANLVRANDMVKNTRAVIVDPNKSYVDKLNAIQQNEKFGLDPSDGTKLKAYLDSENRLMAKTYPETKAAMIRTIGGLQKDISADSKIKDVKQFMEDSKAARMTIMERAGAGELTESDEGFILDALDKIVADQNAFAAARLKRETSASKWLAQIPKIWIYGYDNANQDFMKNFNQDRAQADVALVEYFNQTYKKDYDNVRKKEIVAEVTDAVRTNLRNYVRDQLIADNPAVKAPKVESKADIIQRLGISEQEILDTMEVENQTEAEVLDWLRGAEKKE